MGRVFAAAPLLLLPVAAYNILVMVMGGFGSTAVDPALIAPLFQTRTVSGGAWPVSASDALLAASLVVMFIELIKSTYDRRVAVINHSLSICLFVVCLAEMLLFTGFATSTFFLLTLMVLLDVLAGFILGAATRRPEREARSRR